MLDFTVENEFSAQGYTIICGADEAGRGPLAGRVYAGACILPRGLIIDGLNDSKKVSGKNREILFDIIREKAVSFGVAFATEEEIDSINILNASLLAMKRAIGQLVPSPELALIDGNIVRGFDIKAVPIVKGDARSPSIAAASVLAKVSRDRYCAGLDELYPEYGFIRHKGYPTKEHIDAIMKYGPSPVHRKTFLGFMEKMKSGSTRI